MAMFDNQPPATINIAKLRFELTRALQGKTSWENLSNSYLRDLIEINGLGHKAADEVRNGIKMRFYKSTPTERCVQVIDTVHGTEVLLSWNEEADDEIEF